ncbi:MAG: hypothetical protein K0R49_1622, partial [Burkholderiales bacterium]|nr:hypothetical protein [Burkholderiales bacterium]
MYKYVLNSLMLLPLCLLQFSCGNGSGSGSNINNNSVSLSNISTIPVLSNTKTIARFSVDNNSNNNITLTSTSIQADGVTLDQELQDKLVDTTKCSNVTAHASCEIIITPHKLSGSFIIKMNYENKLGQRYETSKLVTYSSHVKTNNGFSYFSPPNLQKSIGNHSLYISLILAEDYSTLSVETQKLTGSTASIICPENNYLAGSICHVIIKYTNNFAQNNLSQERPQIIIKGSVKDDKRENTATINLSTGSDSGNLITSGINSVINPAISPNLVITLFNNGEAPVGNINIKGPYPISISQINGCESGLAVESACTFTISAPLAAANGKGEIIINYSDETGNTKFLSFNAYYIATAPTPDLNSISNSWFINTTVNTTKYQGVYLVNNGDVNFDNIQFGNLNSIPGMKYGGRGQTCINGQSLAPEESCVMVIRYTPTATAGINLANIVTAVNYYNQNGENLSYATKASLAYSAHAATAGTFIAAGDYGAVTATTSPQGAWSIQNNTPFTGLFTTIERMVNNGNLQVIGTGGSPDGSGFIYSSEKGMIWQSASGGVNAPPTGTFFRKITGLTYDQVNGFLVTNNQFYGNLYSINSLGNSNVIWNPVLEHAFDNSPFNLFNFGTAKAYIAPQNAPLPYFQLGVSTNPKTVWKAINAVGVPRAYKAAIYDGINYCVISAFGFISCSPASDFTIDSTWTENTIPIYHGSHVNMLANNGNTSYVAALRSPPYIVTLTGPANPLTSASWTPAAAPPSKPLIWIAYGNGQYVGVSANSIWTSPDGNVWTKQPSGDTDSSVYTRYRFVYYDGNSYWASGLKILKVSTDGINWSNAGISSLTYTL